MAAGCVVVGKTNTPELGWKARHRQPVFGPTLNPWNLDHSPGGSSGGSAAAIAVGHGAAGHRFRRRRIDPDPVVVLWPVGGEAVARAGAERVAPSRRIGSTSRPRARWPGGLADVVAALDVVVGPDPTDLRSLPRPEASWPAALDDAKPPRKVAWSPTLGYAEVDAEVLAICERAVEVMASLGAEVVEVDTVFDADPVDPVADSGRGLQPPHLRRHHRDTGLGPGRSGAGAW